MKVFNVVSNLWGRIPCRVNTDEHRLSYRAVLFVWLGTVKKKIRYVNKAVAYYLVKERESLPSTLTTSVILSSSSGQISGQFVNPKYTRLHFPSRSFSVNGTPLWVVNSNGPPTAAFPHLRFSSSFSAWFVRKGSTVMRLMQERNSSAPGVSVFHD